MMLNTLYSFPEINIYKKMIHLLMYDGKKDRALILFFKTLEHFLQKVPSKKSIFFRRSRVFEGTQNSGNMKSLGFKSEKFIRSEKSNLNPNQPIEKVTNKKKFKKRFQIIGPVSNLKDKKIKQISQTFSMLHKSVQNVLPYLEIRKVRVSGKTRQIPSTIQKNRQQNLALRWFIEAARKRKKKNTTFSHCLALEFLEAFEKQGRARQKRNELHKIAHANRTFLRYRWW